MKQGLTYQLTERKGAADGHSVTYQLTERKGAADGHSEAVPLSGAFNHIDILEFVSQNHQQCSGSNQDTPYH